MLSERICQLLTGYVDGEVSPRQRKVVQRLLRQSAEARALVQQLQEDAEVLRNLPRRRLSHNFSEQVLHTIAERRLHLHRRSCQTQRLALPPWTGVAVAAAVLLMVGICSWLYYAASSPVRRHAEPVAHEQPVPGRTDQQVPTPRPAPPLVKVDPTQHPVEPTAGHPAPDAHDVVKNPQVDEPVHEPQSPRSTPPGEGTVITDLVPQDVMIEMAAPRIALSFPLQEIDQEKRKQRLHEELLRDNGYHLELFCVDYARSFERLRAAFEAHGIRLLIDQGLRNRGFKSGFALYTEELTSGELAKILEQVGVDDRRAEAARRGEGQFHNVIVVPLSIDDRRDLSSWLGMDATKLQSVRPRTPLGVDIHQPLSQGTAEQLARVMAGQGSPRPGTGAALSPASERLALTFLPASISGAYARPTKEVKQILERRRERRPACIQLLVLLHSTKG